MSDAASDPRDERLLDLVRDAVDAAEPGPDEDVLDAIVSSAFRLGPGGAQLTLADLVADSLDAGGVRDGGSTDRVISFVAGGTTVEVHFLPSSDTVVGQVTPAGARSATVETPDQATTVAVDDLGLFTCDVTATFLRVRLDLPEGTGLVTRWMVR